jgi:hypothetical protein
MNTQKNKNKSYMFEEELDYINPLKAESRTLSPGKPNNFIAIYNNQEIILDSKFIIFRIQRKEFKIETNSILASQNYIKNILNLYSTKVIYSYIN